MAPVGAASPTANRAAVAIPPREGFQDATALLFSTCADLRLGQMVAVSNFTLMDSMAAVKVMDARMDSGMQLPLSELPESDRLDSLSTSSLNVAFDPFQPLTVPDVLWIMDRLLACEAAWHQGSALSQTLYTCLYFHSLKSLSHKHPRFQHDSAAISDPSTSEDAQTAAGVPKTAPPPLQLIYKVLRAFVLATVKTIDIAWSELTTKQHLHDGENFSSDKNGVSLFETTDAGYAAAELEDALEWLQSQTGVFQTSQIESIKARLNFRKQMLYAVRLLQSPAEAAPLDVVMHAKFAQRSWALLRPPSASSLGRDAAPRQMRSSPNSSIEDSPKAVPLNLPNRNSAPSAAAASAFDPAYNRRLAWCQALRPISLPTSDETWCVMNGILEELQDVVHVLQRPGFVSWKTFFTYRAIRYQALQPLSATPYIRSLLQTAVCDRNMIASRLPLDWIAETFFHEVALIDPLLLRRASRIGRSNVEGGSQMVWNAPPPLGQRIHYFLQRVAGQLVHYLTTLSQNRARCKRTMSSRLYREWLNISEEAAEIGRQLEANLAPADHYIPDSLFAATQHLALEVMSQITFSGFELELYGRGADREAMWWLASRIQVEQKIVCTDLRDELSKRLEAYALEQRPRRYTATILYLSRQVHLAQALEQLVISTVYLMQFSQRGWEGHDNRKQSLSWPLCPHDEASRHELLKTIFASRVKWMRTAAPARNGPGGSDHSDQPFETLWQEHLAFRAELEATDDETLATVANEKLGEAILHLEKLSSTFSSEQKQELGDKAFSDFTASLLATAHHNRKLVASAGTWKEASTTSLDIEATAARQECQHAKVAWAFEHPWIPRWTPASHTQKQPQSSSR